MRRKSLHPGSEISGEESQEGGFIMVVAVILLGLVASLGAMVMTSGNHTSAATGRGRSWVQALHVAEAGLQEAMIRMEKTNTGFSGNFTGTTDDGTFSVTVTPQGRGRFQVDASGIVGSVSSLRARRNVRITLAPPNQFEAALFSDTSIDTKNNDHIVGDVWANQNVVVDANDIIEGNVTAATGYVQMRSGSRVTKTVQTGGYNPADTNAIFLENNARIDGSARASVTAPTDPTTCGGESTNNFSVRLSNGSVVAGSTTSWGSKQGPGTVGGTVNNNICTAAPATRPMPVYTYNANNYDPATLHEFGTPLVYSATARTDFQNWIAANGTALRGTFTVFQSGPITQSNRLDLSNVNVTGDLTIVSNLPIYSSRIDDDPAITDAVMLLASTYQPPAGAICDVNQDSSDCAVHVKNHFDTSGATATLVYAPFGPVAVKNNEVQFGAVYADNIQIKNNQELTYDPRINRMVGFGPVTLEQTQWLELST